MVRKYIWQLVAISLASSFAAQADMQCALRGNQFVALEGSTTITGDVNKQCANNAVADFINCGMQQNLTPQVLRNYSAAVKILYGKPTTPDFSTMPNDAAIESALENLTESQIGNLTKSAGSVTLTSSTCNAQGTAIHNPALENAIKAMNVAINQAEDTMDNAIQNALDKALDF